MEGNPVSQSNFINSELSPSQRAIAEMSRTPDAELPAEDTKDGNRFGLEILYQPEAAPRKLVQIIFVHGLGGSKRGTWTHSKENFWPPWLPDEKGLENVRIATFGYNSTFNVLAPNTNLSIPTFANQLLFSMGQLAYRHGSVKSCNNYELIVNRVRLFSWRIVWEA
jgi:hypothetical protein